LEVSVRQRLGKTHTIPHSLLEEAKRSNQPYIRSCVRANIFMYVLYKSVVDIGKFIHFAGVILNFQVTHAVLYISCGYTARY